WQPRAPLAAVVLDRRQENIAVMTFDPAGGAGTGIVTGHDGAGVGAHGAHWLEGRSGVLWLAGRGGGGGPAGRARRGKRSAPLGRPGFGLRGLAGADDGSAIVTAGVDPTRQDVWRIPFDGGAPVRLSTDDGLSAAAAKHGTMVITTLLRGGGRKAVVIGR